MSKKKVNKTGEFRRTEPGARFYAQCATVNPFNRVSVNNRSLFSFCFSLLWLVQFSTDRRQERR